MIKVDLITGFLGSGKTTFLKKYVGHLLAGGEHIGILENDFGAANVDMILLNDLRGDNCELEMVAGGCDADCHRRRFKTKLISMAMSGYSRVVIEPSGIFDMDEFFDALREDPLDNWYEIGNVFCIVDALLDDKMSDEEINVLAAQAADAGCLVVSKVQLASPEQNAAVLGKVNSALEQIGCRSFFEEKNVFAKDWEKLNDDDFAVLMKASYRIRDHVKKFSLDDTSFVTKCFLNYHMDIEQFKSKTIQLFKDEEAGKVFRVKGFIPNGDGFYQVNATADAFSIEETKVGQEVVIVIGEDLNGPKIEEILAAKCSA